MQFSIFATLSGLIAIAAAYTTPVGDSPQGNPISRPGLNEQVPIGSPYTITWAPTSAPNTVTLLLLRGPSTNVVYLSTIVEKIPNTGTYTWTPASGLEVDTTGYGIQLIDDVTGFYQYTTQFGIAADPNAVSSSIAATSTTAVVPIPSSTVPATSSVPTTTSSVIASSSVPVTVKPDNVVYSTVIETVTSCPASKSNCPGKTTPTTVAPVQTIPTSSIVPTSWANNTMTTATMTKNSTGVVSSTGFAVSSTALPDQFTGAGDKVRVGCAMGAILVAVLALAM